MADKRVSVRVGLFGLLSLVAATAMAQNDAPAAPQVTDEQAIEPEVERRDIVMPSIDADDFELGLTFGILDIEEFGSNLVVGAYLDYHVTENIFIEGGFSTSTVEDSNFRRFGLPIFPNEEETLTRYSISAGYSLLPGEMFFSENWTMPSALYLIGGLGATEYADEEQFTFNLGIGLRVLPSDGTSVRVEMRDYMFESDLLGENELRHNIELIASFGVYF